MPKIVLLGMPGCGKTYWGQKLANEMAVPFYDLDQVIEKETGQKIAQIFAQHGEQYFRELEQDLLHETISNKNNISFILACGGGTPAYYENMEVINSHGKSIFLDVSIKTIINQLVADKESNRPLLKSGLTDQLESLLTILRTKRLPFYMQAHFHVAEQDLNLDNLKELYNYE